MTFLARLRSWLRAVLHRSRAERDMDAELRSHIDSYAEDLIRSGLPRSEALRRARLEFGGLERVKEECRESRGISFVESLAQDLRFGLRMLRKSPGFTAVAVLTLALGIGANTTVLSVVSSLLLRKPPVPNPDGLLVITSTNPANAFGADLFQTSAADYLDWRSQADDFSAMAAADVDNLTISGGTTPQFVSGARVSANFFNVMEVRPITGRAFLPGEDAAGEDHAALISSHLWKSDFGGDPQILGRQIKINGNIHTIVGVMPQSFSLWGSATQVWCPLVFSSEESGPGKRNFRFLRVFARLKPGVRIREASAQMNTISARLARAHPDTNKGWGARVMTDQEYVVTDWNAGRALFLLMMAVGFVLLIACANVASMLLARNSSRVREFAVRSVLGAGRLRLARQLLTECLLLSVAGSVLGTLLAWWGVRVIVSQFNWNETVAALSMTIGIDSRVLILTATISILVALVVCVVPAAQLARRDPGEKLKQGTRGVTAARNPNRSQRLLVVCQIALSLILLTGAGMFVEDFVAEMRASTGMNPQHVLTASVPTRGLEYYEAPQRQSAFFQNVLQHIAESPDVESAAVTSSLPFEFPDSIRFVVEDHPVARPTEQPWGSYFLVSPGYFKTLQIPVLQGREFTSSDGPNTAPVVIVNAAFAQRYFPNRTTLGRHLLIDSQHRRDARWSEIVGIVGNVNEYLGQQQPRPAIFEPFLARPTGNASFAIRTKADPAGFSDSLRQAIVAVDPNQAISNLRTMNRVIADSGQGDNIMAGLMGAFALVALGMAAAGIFGLLSYLVSQRTHEMGIRMALGAERRNVVHLIMCSGAILIAAGVGIGGLISVMLPRAVGAVISGLGIHQWWILIAGTTLTVTIVALAACYIPARRAMRVDPMVALRYE